MHVRELKVPGCYEFAAKSFPDHRGSFVAPYQVEVFAETLGFELAVRQANHSVSARGVIRGMHFAEVPPGQAKYVYCTRGSMIDYLVDVRVGSPTFGVWDSVHMSTETMAAVYVAEGVAHGFIALEDDTAITYLCSTSYTPGREHGFSPYDTSIGLPWPAGIEHVLSEKDAEAPTLAQAREAGVLPDYAQCQAWYARLRAGSAWE